MKKNGSAIAAILLHATVASSLLLNGVAYAGFWDKVKDTITNPFTDTNGDGCAEADITCRKDLKELGNKIDQNLIQPAINAIGEGVDSAAKVCRQVGIQTCINPNFLNTYAAVKLSANAGLINNADNCGAMVQSAIEGGSQALELYATAQGAPVPSQVMQLGSSVFQQYGFSSCEIVFGRQPNLSGFTKTASGAVVRPDQVATITGKAIGAPSSAPSTSDQQAQQQQAEQKRQQEERERQAQAEQERRDREERDRKEREKSEARLAEINQRNQMNTTMITAGAGLLTALFNRMGQSQPNNEAPARSQSDSRPPAPPQQPVAYPPQAGYQSSGVYPQQGGYAYPSPAGYPSQPVYPPPTSQTPQMAYPSQAGYPSSGVYPQQGGYSYPSPAGYPSQPVYPAPTSQTPQMAYPSQAGYPQQPMHGQQSIGVQPSMATATISGGPGGYNQSPLAALGLIPDPSCAMTSMIIKLINGQTICALPRPPYAAGRYLYNGSTLSAIK